VKWEVGRGFDGCGLGQMRTLRLRMIKVLSVEKMRQDDGGEVGENSDTVEPACTSD
jgi:hypothetical protein